MSANPANPKNQAGAEATMMRFFLTNDDGIAAPGLWAAARTLASMGSVLIVAPANNFSGYGPAHPPTQSMAYERYRGEGSALANITAYSLSATPAACAHVGLSGVFGRRPIDMVVSGVNAGANLGRDVLYSGTVGAALTAQLLGFPAMAISLDFSGSGVAHWETAGWAIRTVFTMWQRRVDSTPLVFNVNVPNLPVAGLSGTQLTTFGTDSFLGKYHFRSDPHDEHTVVATRHNNGKYDEGRGSDTWNDIAAVARGRVSITPLRPFPDLLCVAPWIEAEEYAETPSQFEGNLTR